MYLYKILLEQYCRRLVEGVDLIFMIVCQIFGQETVSSKIQKSYWRFQIKKYCCGVLIGAKGYCRNICFNEGFVCNRNFKNCATTIQRTP